MQSASMAANYASICKKAAEMEKVIHDLQFKAKLLFEHKQKVVKKNDKTESSAKPDKAECRKITMDTNFRNILVPPTPHKPTKSKTAKSNSSKKSASSNQSNEPKKPIPPSGSKKAANSKTIDCTKGTKPTKNESKSSNVSKDSSTSKKHSKHRRVLSPTIIKPLAQTGSSMVQKTTSLLTNRSAHSRSASQKDKNHPIRRPNSAMDNKFLPPTPKHVPAMPRNRALNKTLSSPTNGLHRMTDLYTPYLLAADQMCFLKEVVDRAVMQKKTFTIVGNYNVIRRALEQRGWVEKLRISYYTHDHENLRKLQAMTIPELLDKVNDKTVGVTHKRIIMSKLLARHQVDLYWDQNLEAFKHNPDNVKFTLINTIKRGGMSYSSKLGLCESLKRAHWYQIPEYANFYHPRSYSLTNNGDPDDFVRDFKLTAAMSMLKWVLHVYGSQQFKLISDFGKIPVAVFHFAITECTKFIRRKGHQDIDAPIEDASDVEWNEFLDHFYKAVHIGSHFRSNDIETDDSMAHKSKIMLDKLKDVWPYLDMDGVMNIWILKPIHGSRGIGIYICRTLQYVLKIITENKNSRYVIQKYIERPLLIYNTKFDIRQWFLISSTTPITIWMYKDCYLRFSSQTYNLRKLHESIHLTNNSVQCRYKNCNRDPAVPSYNMWDSRQFRSYLTDIGQPEVFDNVIYPGMKQNVIAAIMLNQDFIKPRKNCFELYGADFMLTEDFQPWLIEINSRPALHASTPVTARMCKEVLDDVVKVVIDYDRAPNSSTGSFELIHKDAVVAARTVDLKSLQLEGESISSSKHFAGLKVDERALIDDAKEKQSLDLKDTKNYLSYVSKDLKDSLLKLLNIIQGEKEKRRRERVLSGGASDHEEAAAAEPGGKSDKNIGSSSARLNEIFTQTFSQSTELLTKDMDPETRRGYFCIKDGIEELFMSADRSSDHRSLCATDSTYHTPSPSRAKLLDTYKQNPDWVFQDVYRLIATPKHSTA